MTGKFSSDPWLRALDAALTSFSEHINARAWESVRACDEMHSAIVGV